MARSPSVTLISMPWTTVMEPSLGLGILRAVLDAAGIPARVEHRNLELLRWLTPTTYIALTNVFALNDFLFSATLDPQVTPRQLRHLRGQTQHLLAGGSIDERTNGGVDGVMRKLLALRNETIPRWLDAIADDVARSDATLVGFSCMFDQTIASAALAQRIRERAPGPLLALGGYAVRPPTGEAVMSAFPWIDAICVGEGERVIVELARASAGLQSLTSVPGILVRERGNVHLTVPAPAITMDEVPVPNYDDFFTDVASLSNEHHIDVDVTRLPVENSRGCWWGAVHHCVFCGIHDDDLAFRTRSAQRVMETLDTLATRHGIHQFRFADYILPHTYHKTLVSELIRRGAPYEITCEVKANFTAERFARLAAAGFSDVQPGVESFSTAVLKRMDKGVAAIQNVHTLLLGRRYGVHIDYNLLYGLPGDRESEYEEMLRQLPRLVHLDPPDTRLEVQITRYAPLQTNPARFGLTHTPHAIAYEVVFSRAYLERSGFDLDAYCYYFERPFENPPRLERLFRRIDRLVDEWRSTQRQRMPALWYLPIVDGLQIIDSRTLSQQVYTIDERSAAVLLAAEEPALEEQLPRDIVNDLDAHGLLFRDGAKVISLVLPIPATAGAVQSAA